MDWKWVLSKRAVTSGWSFKKSKSLSVGVSLALSAFDAFLLYVEPY